VELAEKVDIVQTAEVEELVEEDEVKVCHTKETFN
jgi:hypothetical protein